MEAALEQDEHLIKGKAVTLRKGLLEEKAKNMTRNLQEKKLFVTGLPKSNQITKEIVKSLFERFGPVERVLMSYEPRTEAFRGFCYVIMAKQ